MNQRTLCAEVNRTLKGEAGASSAGFRLVWRLLGLENDIKAFSWSRMIAVLSAVSFSCGSGVGSRCTRLQQKYLGGALYLCGGQRFVLALFLARMPSWAIRLYGIT